MSLSEQLRVAVLAILAGNYKHFSEMMKAFRCEGFDARPVALGVLAGLTYNPAKQKWEPNADEVLMPVFDSKGQQVAEPRTFFTGKKSTRITQIQKASTQFRNDASAQWGSLDGFLCAIIPTVANMSAAERWGVRPFTFQVPETMPTCCTGCLGTRTCHGSASSQDEAVSNMPFGGEFVADAARWVKP